MLLLLGGELGDGGVPDPDLSVELVGPSSQDLDEVLGLVAPGGELGDDRLGVLGLVAHARAIHPTLKVELAWAAAVTTL